MVSVSTRHCVTFFTQNVCFTSGGKKKAVATIDVRDGKLNLYNDSFEWEGNK